MIATYSEYPIDVTVSAPEDADDAANAELVARLLGQLRAEVSPIALNGRGVSTVLRLESGGSEWWIEPPSAGSAPAPGQRIGMSFRVDGVVARCAAVFVGEAVVDGRAAWRLRYPRRIDYPQQRQAYRAVVVPPRSVAVQLRDGDGSHAGDLLDLSSLGFGAALSAAAKLQAPALELSVLIEPPLQLKVQLLHRLPLAGDAGRCRIGGRFVDLSAAQQAQVDHAVAMLQGRWLRSRARR